MTLAEILEIPISPFEEVVAYETLWAINGMTEKKLTDLFKVSSSALPSEVLKSQFGLIPDISLINLKRDVEKFVTPKLKDVAACIYGSYQYPENLRRAEHPIELFYYKGNLDLLSQKAISIVGARKASEKGIRRAQKLAAGLVEAGYSIVSGLAKGIDKAAHDSAIASKGNTIAVIGTPIDEYYPKDHKPLQDYIAKNYLLISQVPFYRYKNENFLNHKLYFPRRNATMAAISEATIIVEASDTSGSLTQARACLSHQKKKLFILDSCFLNKDIKWPESYLKKGAIRVSSLEDILMHLNG